MKKAEVQAYNAGIAAIAALAAASSAALRARVIERPTRYCYAIAALDGIVEAAAELMVSPDGDPDAPERAEPSPPHAPTPSCASAMAAAP